MRGYIGIEKVLSYIGWRYGYLQSVDQEEGGHPGRLGLRA